MPLVLAHGSGDSGSAGILLQLIPLAVAVGVLIWLIVTGRLGGGGRGGSG